MHGKLRLCRSIGEVFIKESFRRWHDHVEDKLATEELFTDGGGGDSSGDGGGGNVAIRQV